jgi:hypothetical protein
MYLSKGPEFRWIQASARVIDWQRTPLLSQNAPPLPPISGNPGRQNAS